MCSKIYTSCRGQSSRLETDRRLFRHAICRLRMLSCFKPIYWDFRNTRGWIWQIFFPLNTLTHCTSRGSNHRSRDGASEQEMNPYVRQGQQFRNPCVMRSITSDLFLYEVVWRGTLSPSEVNIWKLNLKKKSLCLLFIIYYGRFFRRQQTSK